MCAGAGELGMSGRSSPTGDASGGGEAAAALRLTVRKDLFPDPGLESADEVPRSTALDEFGVVSCVKLETDFEQSIDEIAHAKRAQPNGLPEKKHRSGKRRKRKRRSSTDEDDSDDSSQLDNGLASPERNRRRRSQRDTRSAHQRTHIKGGKNLSLVSSSERVDAETECATSEAGEDQVDSDDEVLKCSVKVPPLRVGSGGAGGGGKPYSHTLSQLSSRKRKAERAAAAFPTPRPALPPSGKPRSMLGIVASKSKKKMKKSSPAATYQIQMVDTNSIKLKICKANMETQSLPCSIGDIGQRKSKKKKSSTPVASASSGEEYDPSHGDSAASISVAAPKPRNNSSRNKRESTTKTTTKKKSESSKPSKAEQAPMGPQSVWGNSVPVPVLTKIFEYVITAQGTLPTVLRLGRVCKLWQSVACQPVLWRHVELAPYTRDKWKTDFKLIALLENRLNLCHTLNLAHWKVCNVGCVVACLVDYCSGLEELNLTGWSRLTAEHLLELVNGLTKLMRLDLSLTSEMGGSSTCLTANSMAQFTETMGERLTHLSLANNKFTALQQILTSIASHCSNLEVLDISGARATSHPALVPLEALQKGCPKLRVLRAANSQVVLASATTTQQMEAQGFPCLEELSIAADTSGSGVGEYRLDDEALGRIVRGATRLRLLDLRGLTRISDSGLVRVPAWDLQHLFLGLCNVTRQSSSCLELVCEKWAHSLLEVDLAWASATRPLDTAVEALAEKGEESKLRILNLCGSSVSLEPVKKVLLKCGHLESINLSSCRALPRGMKRLYTGKELQDLKHSLDPARIKAKEEAERLEKENETKKEANTKSESTSESVPERESESSQASPTPVPTPASTDNSPTHQQAQPSPHQLSIHHTTEITSKATEKCNSISPNTKAESSKESEVCQSTSKIESSPKTSNRNWNLDQFSPSMPTTADSSSAPHHESRRVSNYTQQESPLPRPDTQTPSQDSPELQQDAQKVGGSWNLEQFKTTPNHKSEASPLGKSPDGSIKGRQYSPVTSMECKPSPEGVQAKPDIKTPNHWNYGNYSPMPRQDGQYSSHNSPYSAQPSPAQPSPYSAQPSPYSTQPSPYSTQQSPYSSQQSPYSQPSPDTSQITKPELQKSGTNWNLGGFSPMTKPSSQYSPHPSTHTSPDPGVGVKSDAVRPNSGKAGQFSPMSRQERHHHSPYSPRPSIESPAGVYPNRKSPGMGNFNSMMRSECHIASGDAVMSRVSHTRQILAPPPQEPSTLLSAADLQTSWNLEGLMADVGSRGGTGADATWLSPGFPSSCASGRAPGAMPLAEWGSLPPYQSARPREELPDWRTLGEFQVEPPPMVHNSFLEHSSALDALVGHASHQYVDESFGDSRVD